MSVVKQVRGVKPSVARRLARGATRQQDMPPCSDCGKIPVGASVSGYDGKWRCLKCNDIHAISVLRESGNAAPNASEETISTTAPRRDDSSRQRRAKEILAKYGVAQKA